jgi:hypothetical protein
MSKLIDRDWWVVTKEGDILSGDLVDHPTVEWFKKEGYEAAAVVVMTFKEFERAIESAYQAGFDASK